MLTSVNNHTLIRACKSQNGSQSHPRQRSVATQGHSHEPEPGERFQRACEAVNGLGYREQWFGFLTNKLVTEFLNTSC